MANGYMGKILNVDLTTGSIETEALDENICRDYIGGYGMVPGFCMTVYRPAPTRWDRTISWGF